MRYEVDEETATRLRQIVEEWHKAMIDQLKRVLQNATGQLAYASIQLEIAKTYRQRDEILAALGKRKGT